MATPKETVLELLEHYPDIKRQIEQLHYECAHQNQISQTEVIESMSFGGGMGVGIPAGYISDKTMYIALNYQDKTIALNHAKQDGLASVLLPLELAVERLEHYVGLLVPRQATVIRMFYFERRSWSELSRELGSSPRTEQNRRGAAIRELTKMYALAMDLQEK